MSLMDQAMKANEQFAKKYDPKLGGRPAAQDRDRNLHGPAALGPRGDPWIGDCGY